jgi:hypothetical protein
MRLRLSDAVTSAVLAEHYRTQAEMCHQMARMTVSPFKEGWLEFAEEFPEACRLAGYVKALDQGQEPEASSNKSRIGGAALSTAMFTACLVALPTRRACPLFL